MGRFLLFSLPLLLLLIAVFNLVLEVIGQAPDLGPLVGWHASVWGLPGAYVLGTWALEAVALTALYLLVDARGGWAWVNGLATGWIAWVFRGPLLVMTASGAGGLHDAWWSLASRWLILYTLAGLLLAFCARLGGLRAGTAP